MCSCINEYISSIFTGENLEYILKAEAIYTGIPQKILSTTDANRQDAVTGMVRLQAYTNLLDQTTYISLE